MYAVLNANEYDHIAAELSRQNTTTQAHLPAIGDITPTQDAMPQIHFQVLPTEKGIRIAGQDYSHTPTDITVIVTITHTGVAL